MPSRHASRTYGTVSADRQKQMSGLEFVQGPSTGRRPSIRLPAAEGRITDGNGRLLAHGTTTCLICQR